MEIHEVKKLKKEFEIYLLEIINGFEQRTNTHISAIELDNIDVTTSASKEKEYKHIVTIKLEL